MTGLSGIDKVEMKKRKSKYIKRVCSSVRVVHRLLLERNVWVTVVHILFLQQPPNGRMAEGVRICNPHSAKVMEAVVMRLHVMYQSQLKKS